ncbi:lactadherin [Puma concolor]|uniref:Lactadherin n=1 Tax=Puma concolor TaxID=9696 RepID=A0A6P6HHK8_PUMCO|nr:lactadherin [Puma concolor]
MPGPRLLAALCGALLCASGLLAFSGDFCDSSQCLNGGTCLLGRDNTPFYCLCPEGFTGIICNETEKGPCNPNPCYNDAECQVIKDEHRGDIFTQYICKCPHGYAGVHCEISEYLGLQRHLLAIGGTVQRSSAVPLGPLRSPGDEAPSVGCGKARWWALSEGLLGQDTGSTVSPRSSDFCDCHLLEGDSVVPSVTGSPAGLPSWLCKGAWMVAMMPQWCGQMTDMSAGWRCQLLRFLTTVAGLGLLDHSCTVGVTEASAESRPRCAEPLGMKDNTIPDRQITASSIYRTWGLNAFSWYPFYARLDKQGKFNAWTAQTNDASEWLQVDLGTQRQVTGIITQGARDFGHIQYVAAYKVAYSNNSMNWTEYRDQGALDSKIFPGNLDNNSHKKNMFEMPFLARFVRVLPIAWHNRITLRVELLGC